MKSFDGTTITANLYKPAAKFTGPRPVMVQIHGGPDDRDRVRWQGRSNYFLNEMGIALLWPNVRGSAGFGRKFSQMDDGKGRDGAVKDIGALLDWIKARPDLDQDRVVLAGASYGGWLALEAGIAYNDRIRGIIEGAGMTEPGDVPGADGSGAAGEPPPGIRRRARSVRCATVPQVNLSHYARLEPRKLDVRTRASRERTRAARRAGRHPAGRAL